MIESHVGNTGNIVPFSSLNAAAVETSVGLAARGAGLDYGKIMIWNNYKKNCQTRPSKARHVRQIIEFNICMYQLFIVTSY